LAIHARKESPERQFAGPLQDTIIQRWRDPVDGMICYIYLPIMAVHSAPAASGYVQYGANTIGSISCVTAAGARSSTPAPKGIRPKRPQNLRKVTVAAKQVAMHDH
jgi:hypothetical protein